MKEQPDDIDDYSHRMVDLLQEARSHGIAAYCILYTTDPISRTSSTRYIRTADHVLAMGMLQVANLYLQEEYMDEEQDDDGLEGTGT